jgi:uncharacterized glyoxalase superfamily protein PhnB
MNSTQIKQTVAPYFMVLKAAQFVDFTKHVFNSEVILENKADDSDGVIHGEMKIGNSTVYYADTGPDGTWDPALSAQVREDGPVPIHIMVHVEDVKATHKKAIDAGATSITDVTEETGNMGGFIDPFTNLWWVQSSK